MKPMRLRGGFAGDLCADESDEEDDRKCADGRPDQASGAAGLKNTDGVIQEPNHREDGDDANEPDNRIALGLVGSWRRRRKLGRCHRTPRCASGEIVQRAAGVGEALGGRPMLSSMDR